MTAVIYGSKYGSTKQYAEWIAEELEADVFDVKGSSIDVIEKYDTVIFGGGLYAGGITGLDFIAKNIDRLKNSRLIIFTCGIADPA
ncbi:MAG: flavodoxin domain-containing protein, partial [Clostridia bacterium]|nr:flavodoxin domain-containing protein [Clostridia bacterium]